MTIIHQEGEVAEPLLKPGEVATVFRVHPATIRRWVRTGRLPAIRIGATRRFRQSDIRNALAAEETPEAVSL